MIGTLQSPAFSRMKETLIKVWPRSVLFLAALLLLTLSSASGSFAQNRRKASAAQQKVSSAQDELTKSRAEFARLTEEYKKSLEVLVTLFEKNVKQAEEKASKIRELYREGLVSKREVEESDEAVKKAQAQVENARKQIRAADEQVAQMMVEAKEMEELAKATAKANARLTTATSSSSIRYAGAGNWLLSESWKIQQFFQQKFGRPLPVSAFGQTALHNRWGLDHRNSMDVGLSPDSIEGQALMGFLRANGIPFLAFRGAISGTATGPHIHIGLPSRRIAQQ